MRLSKLLSSWLLLLFVGILPHPTLQCGNCNHELDTISSELGEHTGGDFCGDLS